MKIIFLFAILLAAIFASTCNAELSPQGVAETGVRVKRQWGYYGYNPWGIWRRPWRRYGWGPPPFPPPFYGPYGWPRQ
ncbi:hypothetical protein Tcan_16323 [Toxocara canis]|uniref:Uncharacterized protein n=1 Tax=Toxocara canis TaxID=6265 RepID=A0A0B2VY41_TOXCA|nr:hypothetical protein Tcan_16323 [Toxocara canis]